MHLADWLLLLSGLLAGAVVIGIFARHVRLQITVVLAVAGLLAGSIGGLAGFRSPLRGELFEEVVVLAFLPLLAFQAALGLSTRAFLRNLLPILTLAIPALIVSAAVVGVTLHFGLGVPLLAALLFGALISATDPVAVVAIFHDLGVPRRLLTLVEGESLLNDGVAIVLFNILLAAALGGQLSVAGGIFEFLKVFLGGAALGLLIGLLAGLILPWLDRLLAGALTVAVAYGSFVLADHILGFSGVMASVAAGLALGGLAPSRASEAVRQLWEDLWEALGYIANAILFLLIGLAINPLLLIDDIGPILLTIVAALIARAIAVMPLVRLLEAFARIPRVGRRNEAVMIWGGLRGGVALALALALPETLPEREMFIALTGGVVLTTLLLNATTIGWLVHRLKLDEPSRTTRYLIGVATLAGIDSARERLAALGLKNPAFESALAAASQRTTDELRAIDLREAEQLEVLIRSGLQVEYRTYQHLRDAGLLPPSVTRTLLHEVTDKIDDLHAGRTSLSNLQRRERPLFDRLWQRVSAYFPDPNRDDPVEISYAEAVARRVAVRRTSEAWEVLARHPAIEPRIVEEARQTFLAWEQEAEAELNTLDQNAGRDRSRLHYWQAAELARVTARDTLEDLATLGLISHHIAEQAVTRLATDLPDVPGAGPTQPAPDAA